MRYSDSRFSWLLAACLLMAALALDGFARSTAANSEEATVESAHFLPFVGGASLRGEPLSWPHLSTTTGDLPSPEIGSEQVAALVGDLDGDGRNDFVIASRRGPEPSASIVWYQLGPAGGWTRRVVEPAALPLEAGGALYDVDRDGDLDLILGSNRQDNTIWWWENPAPAHDSGAWTRRVIRNSGAVQHHDMMFGEFDGDAGVEFVFWNQGAERLYVVEVPAAPRTTEPWPGAQPIFTAPGTSYEGLAQGDVDGDGRNDIIAGGYWLSYEGADSYRANPIAPTPKARVAVGQLKAGGRPEIVIVPGDSTGLARWYEWDGSDWIGHNLVSEEVLFTHSLALGDANGDGATDIFLGEMAFDEADARHNPDARSWLFYGDGQGLFETMVMTQGFGHHESRLADLDGDGDLDILGKPFSWQTPRLDIWLNPGGTPACDTLPIADWAWRRYLVDPARPGRAAFIFPLDVNSDGQSDFITGKFWYANPGMPGGQWTREPLPAPIEDTIATYDFDGDGDLDLLATTGPTLPNDGGHWWPVVWARNEGNGAFTVFQNLDVAGVTMPANDPIQGVAIARFTPDGPLEVALTWDDAENPARNPYGVLAFTVPADPAAGVWSRRQLSDVSVGEQLTASDVDGDGDLDLFMGAAWLRNEHPAPTWTPIRIYTPSSNVQTSRHALHDLDGDGDSDAIIGFAHMPQKERVVWFERPADPTAPWPVHALGSLEKGAAESLDVVDLDHDGDVDVVAGEYAVRFTEEQPGATLWIFENRGGGEWVRHLVYTGDSHYQSSRAVDIDGDGDFDIIAKGWFKNEVYLYENTTGCAP